MAALVGAPVAAPLAQAGAPAAAPGPSGAAGAGGEGGEVERAKRREMKDRLRREVMEKMRAMRMWKLTEELKLDEATAAKVFPLLAKFDERARDMGREKHEIARGLVKETESDSPNPARLRTLTDQLLANRAKRNALDEERFHALRAVLTPVQYAKLVLLLPRLEDEFRRRIREAWAGQNRAVGRAERGRPGPGRDVRPF